MPGDRDHVALVDQRLGKAERVLRADLDAQIEGALRIDAVEARLARRRERARALCCVPLPVSR